MSEIGLRPSTVVPAGSLSRSSSSQSTSLGGTSLGTSVGGRESKKVNKELEKWEATPKNLKVWRFLSQVIPAVDFILDKFMKADTDNPLAEIFYESMLSCREILNCWLLQRFHDTALESLSARAQTIEKYLGDFRKFATDKYEGVLFYTKKPGGSFRESKLYINLETLYEARNKKALVDLRSVTSVQEIHTGKDPEFNVLYKNATGDNQTLFCRAKSDSERQEWLNLFFLYQQRNKANAALYRASIRQRLHLYTTVVHSKVPEPDETGQIDVKGSLDKAGDYLFATTMCDDPAKLAPIKPKLPNTPKHEYEQRSKVGVIEKFQVKWPQKLGKDKNRMIEVDLNAPPCISLHKGEDDTKEDVVFYREDLLDYKLDFKTLECSLHFIQKGREKTVFRRFVFPNDYRFRRFADLMVMFQALPDNERLVYMHDDVLHFLSHITTETGKPEEKFSSGTSRATVVEETEVIDMFSGQLHSLFIAMSKSCPDNTHCWELMHMSHELHKLQHGDLRRVKLLISKFYATHEKIEIKDLKCECGSKGGINLSYMKAQVLVPASCTNTCLLRMYKSFIKNRGIEDLRRLLDSPNPEMLQWTLKAIFQVFVIRPHADKCQGTVEIPGDPADWTPSSFPLPWYMNRLSQNRPLTSGLIEVLFEIILGETKVRDEDVAKPEGDLNVLNKPIVEKGFIPSILSCLKRADKAGAEKGLSNIVLLIKRKENADAFLECGGWQKWIFPLLFDQGGTRLIDQTSMVYKLTVTILTNLHYTWLAEYNIKNNFNLTNPDDEKKTEGVPSETEDMRGDARLKVNIMYQSVLVILKQLYGGRFNRGSAAVARQLLSSIFTTITARSREFTNNYDYDYGSWDNFFHLLTVAEEFIFYSNVLQDKQPTGAPTQVFERSLWVDEDGQCLDFSLAEKLLETLKALGFNQQPMTTCSVAEKKLKALTLPEFEFWTNVHLFLKGLSRSSVEMRTIILRQVSATLSERNQKFKTRVLDYRRGKGVNMQYLIPSSTSLSVPPSPSPTPPVPSPTTSTVFFPVPPTSSTTTPVPPSVPPPAPPNTPVPLANMINPTPPSHHTTSVSVSSSTTSSYSRESTSQKSTMPRTNSFNDKHINPPTYGSTPPMPSSSLLTTTTGMHSLSSSGRQPSTRTPFPPPLPPS